jgi:hypothetical protein
VDPQLAGKVKITVIATGFERKAAVRHAPDAASTTPVDLNVYSAHLNHGPDARSAADTAARTRPVANMAESAAMASGQAVHASAPPAVGVSRRPVVELSLPGLGARVSGAAGGENVFEASSPLDVPAFLRRQT